MPRSGEKVQAGPTKSFFVDMLTRDIDLVDAILDLLDNSVDGVLRQIKGKRKSRRPYDGYWAKISIGPDRFEILDNCGGIPRSIAKNSAFMLGRPDLQRDADVETVGMYGIGMKRAIFKMGRRCVVTSQPLGRTFDVTISPGWFQRDDDWHLPLKQARSALECDGTRVVVSDLKPEIASKFEPDSTFVAKLHDEIACLFALIIEKGFAVHLNGQPVQPVDLTLLAPSTIPASGRKGIAPYAFKGTVEGVSVELGVGFHRRLATQRELDSEAESKRSRSEAGWTVVCNDRVVLHADTSRVTGWGTANVPRYHGQFISISGVVFFRSKNSLALPLNTTKRGLDMQSPVYLYVLDIMREGMKQFMDFTNKWKTREEETNDEFDQLQLKSAREIVASVSTASWTNVRKGGSAVRANKFIPTLPVPESKNPMRRIVFSRRKSDIEILAEYLFEDPTVSPADVGARCFDDYLDEAQQ